MQKLKADKYAPHTPTVPILEKKYDARFANNEKYQAYKRSTSLLIPMPPSKEVTPKAS